MAGGKFVGDEVEAAATLAWLRRQAASRRTAESVSEGTAESAPADGVTCDTVTRTDDTPEGDPDDAD